MSDIVMQCDKVSHRFGTNKILFEVDLRIPRGQFLGLVGESGCGKSTLLRAMLGTHPATGGQILMNGHRVDKPSRERGIVYQRYSLFPFLTAVENVAFGLKLEQFSIAERVFKFPKVMKARKQHLEQAAEILTRFKLKDALNHYPAELSGGMCQRVAIAQALIVRPDILLLDEPFGALDEATREEMHEMLSDLYEENLQAKQKGENPPHTIIMVTHELNEAIKVADRVVALSRNWLYKKEFPDHPGAIITYDEHTPAYPRDLLKQADQFKAQRSEIRDAAFAGGTARKRDEIKRPAMV